MLKLNSILLCSEDPQKLADFYSDVFNREPDWQDYGYFGFAFGKFMLSIGPHDKVKGINKHPERVLINFDTYEVKEEFERIKTLGTKVIAEPYKMGEDSDTWIATFADPDGNYFQLMTPWEETN
jgi:predicted enzyme related to lactoylglutathione lyase